MKFWITLAGLLLVGCVSTKTAPLRALSQAEFLNAQATRSEVMERLRGTALLRYQVNGKALNGKAAFIRAVEGMRLEVRDPVGTLRYFLVGRESEARAYYQDEHVIYKDARKGAAYFERFFGWPMQLSQFSALLLGILPAEWRQSSGTWSAVGTSFEGRFQSESGPLGVRVAANGLLERVELESGGRRFVIEYSDFDACCSSQGRQAELAHTVRVVLPKPGEQIEIEWDHLDVIQGASNPRWFELDSPRGARNIQLK